MNSYLLAVVGSCVVHRTLRIFGEHQMIRQLKRHEWVLVQINFVLLIICLGALAPIMTLFVIAGLLVFPILVSILRSRWNEHRFHIETVDLYEAMLMDVRSGLSARESIQNSGQNLQWSYPHRETISYVLKNNFSDFPNRQKSMLVRAREISSILNSGARVADRIKFYRDQWALIRRLERRRGAATQQSKAQAIVISILYFLVSGYQFLQDPRFLTSKWFILGSGMMVTGLFLITRIQRSFRWKV